MKPMTPHQILDEIAQEHTPQHVHLSNGILSQIRKENQKTMNTRRTAIGFLVLAALLVVLLNNPTVVRAIQRLLGYVPGVGMVEQSSQLRTLASPVEMKRGDTVVKVMQAVLDAEHTLVEIQVENLPALSSPQTAQPDNMCHEYPLLRLKDGTTLRGKTNTADYWLSGYRRAMVFPALPLSDDSAVLVVPCLEGSYLEADEPAWEISMQFAAAPPDMTVFPLIDLPTPTVAPTGTPAQQAAAQQSARIPAADELSLTLSKYIQTDDGIILAGGMQTTSTDIHISTVDSIAIHLHDAAGQEIPLEEDYSLMDSLKGEMSGITAPIIVRNAGSFAPGKATLTVDSAWVDVPVNGVTFDFDPGENPQPNQTWQLDQVVEIAGYTIRFTAAQMAPNGSGLNFQFEAPNTVGGVVVMDPDHKILGGGGGPGSTGFTYADTFPQGVLHLNVTGLSVNISGGWQTTVDLPELANPTAPAVLPAACMTQAAWRSALQSSNGAIPAGLGGTLVFSEPLEPDFYYWVLTAKLDGSEPQKIKMGDSPTLSPDNSRIIYSDQTGLQLYDLATGAQTTLAGTTRRDRGALWSPDGTQIAFTRGPASGLIGGPGPRSIVLANPDGSNQRALLENSDANIAQAWLPDGENLVYTVKGPAGSAVSVINILTRKVTPLFNIQYVNAGVSVSPDGKQVAYEEMLPGDRYAIYVSNLDGSNKRLVVDSYPIVATVPQWSPDGRWLIVSVHDTSVSENHSILTLIELDTCQIIPLLHLNGYVSTWNP
jgi:hypothetical protein